MRGSEERTPVLIVVIVNTVVIPGREAIITGEKCDVTNQILILYVIGIASKLHLDILRILTNDMILR